MAYTIDRDNFLKLSSEIVKLLSVIEPTKKYDISSVEITCILYDYKDGLGYRVVSRALVRNPTDNIYDEVHDFLGSPEDALKNFIEDLKERAEKDPNFNYKIKNNLN